MTTRSRDIPVWLRDPVRVRRLDRGEERALFERLALGREAAARLDAGVDPGGAAGLKDQAAAGERARGDLIEHNLPLVWNLIYKCLRIVGRSVAFSDLDGAGYEALVRAVDAFDPGRGNGFAAYAWTPILHSLFDEVTRIRPGLQLSIKAQRLLHRLEQARLQLLRDLGREPSLAEMAEKTGIPRRKAEELWQAAQSIPLDQIGADEDDPEATGRTARRREPEEPRDEAAAVQYRIALQALGEFLTHQLAGAPGLGEQERPTARRLAARCLEELACAADETRRPDSPLDWRIATRALAGRREGALLGPLEGVLPVADDYDEALVRRDLRLWVLRTFPPPTPA